MVKPVNSTQSAFDFGENPEKPEKRKVGPSAFDEELRKQEDARKEDKQEKAKAKAAENEEFRDKRVKTSSLIAQAELAKMKELTSKPKGGGGGSGTGNGAEIKMLQNPKAMKSGGKVKSASARADGIAIRGKTRA
jgi:hypothetical protein